MGAESKWLWRYRADLARGQNRVGQRIRAARKAAGMTLEALAAELEHFGVSVKVPTVNHWEMGTSVPNAYQLIALCHALRIPGVLDGFGGSLPGRAGGLNAEGRRLLSRYRAFLEEDPRYLVSAHVRTVDMPVSALSASAGFGDALEDGRFEMQSFPASAVPDGADFAVPVNGDSMEPLFRDGQLVWVRRCDVLSPGEIGLFIVDDEGFVKIYDEREPDPSRLDDYVDSYGILHPEVVLLSRNPAYPPRPVPPESSFRIVGKVLCG